MYIKLLVGVLESLVLSRATLLLDCPIRLDLDSTTRPA